MHAHEHARSSSRSAARDARSVARASLRYVFEQSLPGMFVNVIISGLLCLALWDHVDRGLLVLGWSALAAVSALRLVVRRGFLAADLDAPGARPALWLGALWAGLLVTASLWGVGCVVLIEHAPIEHQFLIAIVLCGMGAGGISYLAPIRGLYAAYVLALLGPIVGWFWLQEGSAWKPMAGMSLVFGIALVSTAASFTRNFRQVSLLATALSDSESRLRRIIDLVPAQIFVRDARGRFLLANDATARFFGRDPQALHGKALGELDLGPGQAQALLEADGAARRHAGAAVEEHLDGPDGVPRLLRTSRVPFADPLTHEPGVLGVSVDVTDERAMMRALAESESRFASAFANAPVGMMLVDEDGRVLDLNREVTQIFETTIDDWRAKPFWHCAEEADSAALRARFATFQSGAAGNFTLETRQRTSSGRSVSAHVHASTVPDRTPGGVFAIVQIQDVTRARELADRLPHQATHDPLTDLVNRRELEARLEHALDTVRVDRASSSVLFVDIDNFKVVNDSCGHTAGDALLVEIARLLESHVRRHDTVARLGGDEFAILLEHCAVERAAELGRKLCEAVDALRFHWEQKLVRTSVSIGAVDLCATQASLLDVMNAADGACYAAKSGGRNQVYVFRPDDADLMQRQGEIESVAQLTHALEHDEFMLFAQPIQRTREEPGSAVTHFEILVRMRGEAGQVRVPGQFLPAAERYGLAPKLDRWVVEHTLRWFAERPETLAGIAHCAINLSGQTLMDPAFGTFLETCFETTGVPPEAFCFEITETAAISNLGHAQRFIGRIAALGCRFALDDFGSGVSSLGYLKSLPVDVLKIDGIFVRDLVADPVNAAMIRAIGDIASVMRMQTVAEFVENREQLERLGEIGIDFVQGYLVGRPKPIEDLLPGSDAASTPRRRLAAG